MKLFTTILITAFLFLFIGETTITCCPLKISMERPLVAVAYLLFIMAVCVYYLEHNKVEP